MRKRDRMRQGGLTVCTSFGYPRAEITPIGEEICVCLYPEAGRQDVVFWVDRRLARMLAKRINQALDASQ